MNPKTIKCLATLTPEFSSLVKEMLTVWSKSKFANQCTPEITFGYRTPEEQDALYKIGRTIPGAKVTNAKRYQSMHNYRIAVDVVFFDNTSKQPIWKKCEQFYESMWELTVSHGLDKKGLFWANNWKSFPEMCHFQLGRESNWKELAKKHGIDPVTLTPISKK